LNNRSKYFFIRLFNEKPLENTGDESKTSQKYRVKLCLWIITEHFKCIFNEIFVNREYSRCAKVSMSNKSKFNRDQAIANATNLYWEKGYHATSMRNLQDAIDMRPGSIYAEFGSKDGVFKASLEHYAQLGINQLECLKTECASPLTALKTFVKQAVIETQKDAPSCVCMLAKTVAELTEEQGELLSTARESLKLVEHQFANTILEAQQVGEVAADKNAIELARFIQIQITGLRMYAKTCDNVPLDKMIDDMFENYPF